MYLFPFLIFWGSSIDGWIPEIEGHASYTIGMI